jgi:hypothetical protein
MDEIPFPSFAGCCSEESVYSPFPDAPKGLAPVLASNQSLRTAPCRYNKLDM